MPSPGQEKQVQFHFHGKSFSFRNRRMVKQVIIRLFARERKRLSRLDYIFCSDAQLLDMNRRYLKHDFYTDILSFDLSGERTLVSGEIYISTDRVKENAHTFKNSFSHELHRVMFHGALHLCGFDDHTPTEIAQMRKKEAFYLKMIDKMFHVEQKPS